MDRTLKSNDNRLPAPNAMAPAMHRPEPRLIDHDGVAALLGYGRDWFAQNRARLEASGFPAPVLGDNRRSGKRWDRKAIDLWLDSRMDPALHNATHQTGRPQRADINDLTADNTAWEDTLINRAKQFGKGEPNNDQNPSH